LIEWSRNLTHAGTTTSTISNRLFAFGKVQFGTMGKSGMKDKGKKKKGPKGKKARAKAKLDRQWNEQPLEDDRHRHIPRGSLSSRRPQGSIGTTTAVAASSSVRHQMDVEYNLPMEDSLMRNEKDRNLGDSDSSASSGEESDGDEAFSTLLNSITRKKIETTRAKYSDDESSEMDASGSGDETSEDDEEAPADDESGRAADGEESQEHDAPRRQSDERPSLAVDPFAERFLEPPFPENEDGSVKDDDLMASLRETVKVPLPHLSWGDLDMQVSRPLAERLGLTEEGASSSPTANQHRALGLVECCCRENLKLLWKHQQQLQPSKRKLFHENEMQSVIAPLLFHYADLLLTTPITDPTESSSTTRGVEETLRTVLLHILNHVLTSRGRIDRHNRRIQEWEKEQEERVDPGEREAENPVWRDQGFTRPTVLVLLPTRHCCYQFVQSLSSLLTASTAHVENMDRFQEEYGPTEDTSQFDEGLTESQQRHRRKVLQKKGAEWNDLFGDNVNSDDDFKIGVALKPKGPKRRRDTNVGTETERSCSVKLFSDFYRSDLILASPLGLKMTTGTGASEDDEETGKSEPNADFLSSIEICLVSRADVLLMQNWDHVNDVLNLMNQLPSSTSHTDFSRVREYMLAGQAAYWRQLIMLSSLSDPAILSCFRKHAKSRCGLVRIRRRFSANDASIASVLLPTRQVFQRISCPSFDKQSHVRVQYFVDKVLPQILRHNQSHTMVFIPSYFEFISVRNVLLKKEVDFVSVNEYSRSTEVNRGRARFLQGRKPLMLYTGRAHFFHRHAIRGVRHLVFLGLPEHAEFYADHVNFLNEGLPDSQEESEVTTASSLVLYTKYDSHALERVVGTSNCSRMVKGEKSLFVFSS
jgi:U3 small nucleolar RNA-associated protein 25